MADRHEFESAMSLKAKIEAVIYAAEEPVTLAQLTGLLGDEAQAELDRLAAQQGRLPLGGAAGKDSIPLPSEPEALNEEVLDIDELLAAEEAEAATETVDGTSGDGESGDGELGDGDGVRLSRGGDSAAEEAGSEEAGALDERQLARLAKERERAVREYFRRLLDELMREYASADRGLEIREVASGFRLATKPEYHDAVRGFAKSLKPPLKLSLQALETLAVVAYKQPVTAPEVSEIRGVDSGGVLGSLMARKLVTTAGRKQVIGRPILYRTTKDFLLRFGLKDVGELPSIEEFEKMAGELAEGDAAQEEIPMSGPNKAGEESVTGANLREEEEATEPQADGDSTSDRELPVDGRMTVPSALRAGDSENSSAVEAEIQSDETAERREGTE